MATPRGLGASIDATESEHSVSSEEHGTLARQVYQELEARILSGQLRPNASLSLRTLALSLNTSMQPIREAVSRLVGVSALEQAPGRAIRVPELSRAEADELWSLRLLLEGEAAARFAAKHPPDGVRQLLEHTRALRRMRFGADVVKTVRALMAWNVSLVRGADSPMLADITSRLFLRYAPFLAEALHRDVLHDEDFLQFTVHIQDELIFAIEQGDAAAARHLRCADIRSFQRYLYVRHGW